MLHVIEHILIALGWWLVATLPLALGIGRVLRRLDEAPRYVTVNGRVYRREDLER